MGERLGRPLVSYLDTHLGIWLAEGKISRLAEHARRHIQRSALLISPMVLLELQFLHEIGRTSLSAKDIQRKLESELGVRVCDLDFPTIAEAAVDEQWTRDPFDRLIVSHARANGLAYLVTSDVLIRKNYPRAIWD